MTITELLNEMTRLTNHYGVEKVRDTINATLDLIEMVKEENRAREDEYPQY